MNNEAKVDGSGLRHNTGKLPIDLVPVSAVTSLARVLEIGSRKYARFNWAKGMKWTICYASAMRHLLKWGAGQDIRRPEGRHGRGGFLRLRSPL